MIDDEIIKNDLISDDCEPRQHFISEFSSQIDNFTKGFKRAVEAFLNLKLDVTERTQRLTTVWLNNCLSSLYVSTKLLIHGYTLPAGNLMRQFGESIALALLCCTERLQYACQIDECKTTFAYHKAVEYLRKKNVRQALQLDSSGIETLQQVGKYYDDYSHSSYVSAGWAYDFSNGNKYYFGAVFDPIKSDLYEQEFETRISACTLFQNVLLLIDANK